jgi:hypothetical protein
MLRPRSLVPILCALIALGVLVAPAQASTQPAAGAFVEAPETILEERQSGGNTFIHLTREATLSGTYTGVGQADQRIVIHADGTFNLQMTIAFTGVACGTPVELTFLVVARGDFTTNTLTGTYTVIGNAPVGKGHGKLTAEPGVGGVYEGAVHCD